MSSSSSNRSSDSISHPSRSSTISSPEGLGTFFVHTYPKKPTKDKKHVIIKMATEFGVIHVCNVTAFELIEMVVDAREGEMTFFSDAFKVELKWSLHPFIYVPEPISS